MERSDRYSDVERFFEARAYAVVGVSANRRKFGNIVYRTMRDKGFTVYPVHPTLETVEGDRCFANIASLPAEVTSMITVVPPQVTEDVTAAAIARDMAAIWMQPGSESEHARTDLQAAGRTVIYGQCILMFLEPVNSVHALHRWFRKLVGAYPQ